MSRNNMIGDQLAESRIWFGPETMKGDLRFWGLHLQTSRLAEEVARRGIEGCTVTAEDLDLVVRCEIPHTGLPTEDLCGVMRRLSACADCLVLPKAEG